MNKTWNNERSGTMTPLKAMAKTIAEHLVDQMYRCLGFAEKLTSHPLPHPPSHRTHLSCSDRLPKAQSAQQLSSLLRTLATPENQQQRSFGFVLSTTLQLLVCICFRTGNFGRNSSILVGLTTPAHRRTQLITARHGFATIHERSTRFSPWKSVVHVDYITIVPQKILDFEFFTQTNKVSTRFFPPGFTDRWHDFDVHLLLRANTVTVLFLSSHRQQWIQTP